MRFAAVVLLGLAALDGHAAERTPAAATGGPEAAVEAARRSWANGDYRAAMTQLDRAQGMAGIDDATLGRVHWYRALCLLAEGNEAGARQQMDSLVEVVPFFQPDPREAPPNVRSLFKERVAAYQRDKAPVMSPPRLLGIPTGLSIAVSTRFEPVPRVVVLARAFHQRTYQEFPITLTQGMATSPLGDDAFWSAVRTAGGMDVVLEAQRANGTPLARLGSTDAPLALTVDPRDVPPPVVTNATTTPAAPATPPEAAADPATEGGLQLAPALWLMAGLLGSVAGAFVVGAVGFAVVFAGTGAVLALAPLPMRQPWFQPVVLAYRVSFWAALVAGALALAPAGVAIAAAAAGAWSNRSE